MEICSLRNRNLYFAKRKSVTLFDVLAAAKQKIVSYKKTRYIPCTKCQNVRKIQMARGRLAYMKIHSPGRVSVKGRADGGGWRMADGG